MSTFGQIGAMLSRSGGKDRDIEDMPERINNMEGYIKKGTQKGVFNRDGNN